MVGPERTLLRDPHRYIAHPHVACLRDGSWLLIATCGPRRAVTLHPPLDPEFITIGIWSDDEGETWSDPAPMPDYGMTGTECGGLTALPGGGVLLNHWRFRWYSEAAAEAVAAGGDEPCLATAADLQRELDASLELDGGAPPRSTPWVRGGGTLTLWRTSPGSRSWTWAGIPDLGSFAGGYGLRGGVVAANGDVLLPLTDSPHYRAVFLIRSRDGGRNWQRPEPIVEVPGCAFEEPAPVLLPDGSLLIILRENTSRRLHAVRSADHGGTWSAPCPMDLAGYPAHALSLADGQLAVFTALRDPPGAILLSLSGDGGETWGDDPIVVAGDLGTHDLGYPTAVPMRDGSLFAAYYRRDTEGVTGVYGRRVQLPHHA